MYIFLNEIAKFLPFYKVACVDLDAKVFGISRKKGSDSMPNECIILENNQLLLSIIVNLDPKHNLDNINQVNWNINRKIMGATNPKEAKEGTIRAEFAESIDANIVHGSDSLDNANIELKFFFPELAAQSI